MAGRGAPDKTGADAAIDAAQAPYGATIAEITDAGKHIEVENDEIVKTSDAMQASYKDTMRKMEALNVTDNQYTKFSVEELDEARVHLESALKQRGTAYDGEKQRIEKNDAICKDFASKAEPVVSQINDAMFTLLEAKRSLDDQLTYVVSQVENCNGAMTSQVAEIKKLSLTLHERKVQHNDHTTLSLNDVTLQHGFFGTFLAKKQPALEQDIEHKKHKGVSHSQVEEINEIYLQYDADRSGSIDKKELRAALFSLGEDASKDGIANYMSKFGNGSVMTERQFMYVNTNCCTYEVRHHHEHPYTLHQI